MSVAATEFQLSRIYAAGWNAANKLSAAGNGNPTAEKMAELNPHESEIERARWNDGFRKALGL